MIFSTSSVNIQVTVIICYSNVNPVNIGENMIFF